MGVARRQRQPISVKQMEEQLASLSIKVDDEVKAETETKAKAEAPPSAEAPLEEAAATGQAEERPTTPPTPPTPPSQQKPRANPKLVPGSPGRSCFRPGWSAVPCRIASSERVGTAANSPARPRRARSGTAGDVACAAQCESPPATPRTPSALRWAPGTVSPPPSRARLFRGSRALDDDDDEPEPKPADDWLCAGAHGAFPQM